MPQLQVVDFGPDPLSQALYQAGSGFGAVLNRNLEQQQENDAVKRLMSKYKPGMSRTDFLRETISSGSLPLDKRAELFEAFSAAEKEDRVIKEKKENEDRQKAAAIALGSLYGMPESISSKLTPDQVLQYVKEVNSGKSKYNLKATQDFIKDPDFQAMSDADFINKGLEFGLDPTEIKRLDDIRKRSQELSDNNKIPPKDRLNYYKDYIAGLRTNADRAEAKINSFRQIQKELKTGKVGPQNVRNFLASTVFKDTVIGKLLETPENQAVRALTYQSIVGSKNDFGVRLSDADLNLVLDKIVSADKTPEVNEKIMELQSVQSRMELAKWEEAQKILNKEENKGVPPMNFEQQITEALKRRTDLIEDFERSARDILAFDDTGKSEGVWMIDPDTGERHLIRKDGIKDFEEIGFRRL